MAIYTEVVGLCLMVDNKIPRGRVRSFRIAEIMSGYVLPAEVSLKALFATLMPSAAQRRLIASRG